MTPTNSPKCSLGDNSDNNHTGYIFVFWSPCIYTADHHRTLLCDFKTRKKSLPSFSNGGLWCIPIFPGFCGSPSKKEGHCSQVVLCYIAWFINFSRKSLALRGLGINLPPSCPIPKSPAAAAALELEAHRPAPLPHALPSPLCSRGGKVELGRNLGSA